MTVASRLPGDEAVLRAAIVERLARAGRKGLAGDELLAELSPQWPEAPVRQTLAALSEEGEAVEWNRRWMPIAASGCLDFLASRPTGLTNCINTRWVLGCDQNIPCGSLPTSKLPAATNVPPSFLSKPTLLFNEFVTAKSKSSATPTAR